MANALAPSVVSPPCASSSAWNSNTIVPSSAITGGRNRTAPAPGPVGWLELPVNEGSFTALSTKVNAPAAPSSSVFSGRSRTSVTTCRAPWTTKGAAASVQPTACVAGRNPSAMCMPYPSREGRRCAGGHEPLRSEEHTSELQSRQYLVCRLLLEKKNFNIYNTNLI